MTEANPYFDAVKGEYGHLQPHGVSVVAFAASLVAKSGPSLCYGLTGYNSGPAQWIQVFDAATLPANGAAPVTILVVPLGENFSLDYGSAGRAFERGVVVCNSSTGPTKTLGSADCWFDVVLI